MQAKFRLLLGVWRFDKFFEICQIVRCVKLYAEVKFGLELVATFYPTPVERQLKQPLRNRKWGQESLLSPIFLNYKSQYSYLLGSASKLAQRFTT
jgi:hypothetical protein